MSLLAALVLALLGTQGTGWMVWLRREQERAQAAVVEQPAALPDNDDGDGNAPVAAATHTRSKDDFEIIPPAQTPTS